MQTSASTSSLCGEVTSDSCAAVSVQSYQGWLLAFTIAGWLVGKCPAASFDHKCLFVHEVGSAIGGMGLPAPIFAISPATPSKRESGFVLNLSKMLFAAELF